MLDNYETQKKKEDSLKVKQVLVDETIEAKKLNKYEIIERMYSGLLSETEELKKILFEDLAVTAKAKEKAEKISKIAFALQSTLDMENGKEISEQLTWLYRFIRYMSKRIQDNDDMNYVQPAYKVIKELNEAWSSIPKELRY